MYRAVVPKCAAMALRRPFAVKALWFQSRCRKSGFSRGFLPLCPAAFPPAAAVRAAILAFFPARDTFIALRGRNSNPMKSTRFSGKTALIRQRKAGEKTRFLICENAAFFPAAALPGLPGL